MKVTYITPIYKTGLYNIKMLYKCLLKQTNDNWIWVIYNDNTEENFDLAVDEIRSWNNDKVIFIDHENTGFGKGTGPAKHIAFKKAEELVERKDSKIFCEVDSDDLIPEYCTQTILDAYKNTKFEFLHGDTIILKSELEPEKKGYSKIEEFVHPVFGYYETADCIYSYINYNDLATYKNMMNIRCYDRSFYKKIGGFDQNVLYGEDCDIAFRVLTNAERIVYVKKQMYFYNYNGNGCSSKIDIDDTYNKIFEKNKEILNEWKNSKMQITEDNAEYMLYKNIK